jgi:UTP--glucose-1-phosphate uridylyltransferase
MTHKVTKAVFPVAGMGTRFLPATKANPKEMLPIVDKPLIQYAAEEAIAAGIKELIFVTSSAKRAIEDHFDKNFELESELIARNKRDLLRMVQDILPKGVSCAYIRQPEALGLGHAVLCARPVVGNEPFAVILADDLIDNGDHSCLKQMVDLFAERGCSLLGVDQIDPAETDKYGIITPKRLSDRLYQAEAIVEKPRPDEAPSALAVVGRYILTPGIFDYLENLGKGAGGEIQLTDAIAQLMGSETVLAYEFDGIRYDCGSKLGYLQATVEYALKHPDLQRPFREYLQKFSLME